MEYNSGRNSPNRDSISRSNSNSSLLLRQQLSSSFNRANSSPIQSRQPSYGNLNKGGAPSLPRSDSPARIRSGPQIPTHIHNNDRQPTPSKQQSPVVSQQNTSSTPTNTKSAISQPAQKNNIIVPLKKSSTTYSNEEIDALLAEGYINIHSSLWDYVPNGAHIRYIRQDNGQKLSRSERFKPGGFVRSHMIKDEKKLFLVETRPGGAKGDPGYISFPIAYDDIEELWKKYDRTAFIEIHLIYTSLAQKKRQIENILSRLEALEIKLEKS